MRIPILNRFTCHEKQLKQMINSLKNKKLSPILDYTNENYFYENITDDIKAKVLKYYQLPINKENTLKLNLGIDISHFYWFVWGLLVDVKENKHEFDYLKFAKNRYKLIK